MNKPNTDSYLEINATVTAVTATEKKSLLNTHRKWISVACYMAGIVWFLLFNVVSISTGELKVRSLYLDENSLLVDSSGTHTPYKQDPIPQPVIQPISDWIAGNMVGNPCDTMSAMGTSCDVWARANGWIMQGLITSDSRPLLKETTVLVLPVYHGQNLDSPRLMLQLASHLRNATWMSKNVLLLFLYDKAAQANGYRHSEILEEWLHCYHSAQHIGKSCARQPIPSGVLRESIIWDIQDISATTNVQVFTAGINGQQPNLDLPSAVLSVFDRRAWLDMIAHPSTSSMLSNSVFTRGLQWVQTATILPEVKKPLMSFFQLCNYMTSLVLGPNGLHGQFIRLNIDSVTIRGVTTVKRRGLDAAFLFRRLEQLLRVCSNLHEELHHSFNLYLFVDGNSFLAFAEYFTSLPLVMLPLLLLYLQYAAHPASNDVVLGVQDIALGSLLGVFPLFVIWVLKCCDVFDNGKLREYLQAYLVDARFATDWEHSTQDELLAISWFVVFGISYLACLLCFLYHPLQSHQPPQQRPSTASLLRTEDIPDVLKPPVPVQLEDDYASGYKLALITYFIICTLWLGLQHYSLAFPCAVIYTLLIWSTHLPANHDTQRKQAPTIAQVILSIATCPLLLPLWLRLVDSSTGGPVQLLGMLITDYFAVNSYVVLFVSLVLFPVHCCVVRIVFSRLVSFLVQT